MAKDKGIRLPSGMGGITRYFDETISKVEMSPGMVIVLAVAVIIIMIILHKVIGPMWFGA
jgi:preprotein translocase subunit Sec61beta